MKVSEQRKKTNERSHCAMKPPCAASMIFSGLVMSCAARRAASVGRARVAGRGGAARLEGSGHEGQVEEGDERREGELVDERLGGHVEQRVALDERPAAHPLVVRTEDAADQNTPERKCQRTVGVERLLLDGARRDRVARDGDERTHRSRLNRHRIQQPTIFGGGGGGRLGRGRFG